MKKTKQKGILTAAVIAIVTCMLLTLVGCVPKPIPQASEPNYNTEQKQGLTLDQIDDFDDLIENAIEKKAKTQSQPSAASDDYIGEDKAKEIAFSHAGITASEAEFSRIKLDRDDGIVFYEVDFIAGDIEYEYEIEAASGTVLKADRDRAEKFDDFYDD